MSRRDASDADRGPAPAAPRAARRTIDGAAARRAFDGAIETHDQAFGSFFLARLLGFRIGYPGGHCVVRFDVEDFMFNPQGSLHGGIIALALDVSMGHLLNDLQGPGSTLEMKTQYMRPVRGGTATAVGRLVTRGRSICFLEASLHDDAGTLAATATATWKFLPPAVA